MLKKIPYSLEQGTKIGPYEVVDILGAGGFSIVYLVKDAAGSYFAAKEYMPAGLAVREGFNQNIELISEASRGVFEYGMKQLEQEANLLESLKHPSILKVVECFNENNTTYLISEYCKGKTLKQDVLDYPEKYNESEIKRIIYPILEAVDELHTRGVLHRDIAPDNIIVGHSGAPVLIDLGSAVDRAEKVENTETTIILKPGYAPLEQYSETGLEGEWSDIYSIGALLYFLVTKTPPVASISRAIKDTHSSLDIATYSAYSEEFLSLINKCLLMDSRSRPQALLELKSIIRIDCTVHYHPTQNINTFGIKVTPENKEAGCKVQQVSSEKIEKIYSTKANVKVDLFTMKSKKYRNKVLLIMTVCALLIAFYVFYEQNTINKIASEALESEGASELLSDSSKNLQDDQFSSLELHIEEVEQDDELHEATEVFNEAAGGEDSSAESNIELKINVDTDADLYANSIYIDRLHTGVNTIFLTPGKYFIKLVSDDLEEKTTEIELLNDSAKELSFQMAKIQPVAVKSIQKEPIRTVRKVDVVSVGEVRIAVVPWGEILVNGKSFGVSPPVKLLKLNVGKHKVEIKNPGFKSFSTTIMVKEGEVANIRHQF